MSAANKVVNLNERTNGGKDAIDMSIPYSVVVAVQGSSDMLLHRWNCEAVEEKAKAAKNSAAKKTDNVESYVYRNDDGEICIPGEYFRQSIVMAAKSKQDPRSPRKSAKDLFNAGIVCETQLASLGIKDWDYLDKRRVVVQQAGINRTRPAIKMGWKAEFQLTVLTPEYIDRNLLNDVVQMAGRFQGVGDFRPTFGRFQIIGFTEITD